MYHPDFSSISLTQEVPPEVLSVIAPLPVAADARVLEELAVLVDVVVAETSTEREADS
jgi:hypothetical protein